MDVVEVVETCALTEDDIQLLFLYLQSIEYNMQLLNTCLLFLLACMAGFGVCLLLYRFTKLFY